MAAVLAVSSAGCDAQPPSKNTAATIAPQICRNIGFPFDNSTLAAAPISSKAPAQHCKRVSPRRGQLGLQLAGTVSSQSPYISNASIIVSRKSGLSTQLDLRAFFGGDQMPGNMRVSNNLFRRGDAAIVVAICLLAGFAVPAGAATETVLHSFAGGSEGSAPKTSPINLRGTLYGTTYNGGSFGQGN